MQRLAEGQRIEHVETVRCRKDGRRIDVSITVSPVRDVTGKITGASTIARDITERKHAENRQHLLNEASNALVSSLDHQLTLPEVAQLIVPALADYCRIALVDEQQQIKEITVNHIDPEKIALVRELYELYKDKVNITHGVQRILQTGKPELVSSISGDILESVQRIPELLQILRALGLES